MSKRTKAINAKPRSPRDFYRTPMRAVEPLLSHLAPGTRFVDPCAGDGAMAGYLQMHGHVCVTAYDIRPIASPLHAAHVVQVRKLDMFKEAPPSLLAISNPPWSQVSRILDTFGDAWWLLSSDWKETRWAQPYLKRCSKIVAVGRVGWMGNNKTGYDNADWYRFHDHDLPHHPAFINDW